VTDRPQLTYADFDQFFFELWGVKPYRWQSNIVEWIDRNRRFPDVVPVATGGGKTSMLDVALFVLALDLQRSGEQRWAPRRIALVVDRRVVVDQNGFRGTQIAAKLEAAYAQQHGSVLFDVASTLASLTTQSPGERGPIVNATVLRGGIVRDETWAQRPDVPALLSSTVDQVGSRLLFRGYGLSKGARPIHGGLLGNDTVILLDEVQLAIPFAQTLDAMHEIRAGRDDLHRFHVCELSATPRHRSTSAVQVPAGQDFDSWFGDPEFRRRTTGAKSGRLVGPVAINNKDLTGFVDVFETELLRELRNEVASDGAIDGDGVGHGVFRREGMVVAVLLNQVDHAVAVAKRFAARPDLDVKLITGRMRGLERDELLASAIGGHSIDELARNRSSRSGLDKPLVIVATQCLEAGADYDFDVVVSECASVDALIQRFGRLDRRGELAASRRPGTGVVIAREADLDGSNRLYGPALAKTWQVLTEFGREEPLNFGSGGSLHAAVANDAHRELQTPPNRAPGLVAAHLDLFSATNPEPATFLDETLWLHGLEPTSPQISVVWRRELDGTFDDQIQTSSQSDTEALEEQVTEWFRLTRPTEGEAVTIPRYALASLFGHPNGVSQNRLPRLHNISMSDVDSIVDLDNEESDRLSWRDRNEPVDRVVAWDGDVAKIVSIRDVGAGTTVVVPTTLGGLGEFGTWDPSSTGPVADRADDAVANARRQLKFRRINALVLGELGFYRPIPVEVLDGSDDIDGSDDGEFNDSVESWVEEFRNWNDQLAVPVMPANSIPKSWVLSSTSLGLGASARSHSVLTYRVNDSEMGSSIELECEGDSENPTFIGQRVLLRTHLRGVGAWARYFGGNVFIEPDFVDDLELAGLLHDIGKADPRFQVWLNDGVPTTSELYAKSGSKQRTKHQRSQARRQAGYPKGMRHELMSIELMDKCAELLSRATDPDLVRHLVATHHGYCRPRATHVEDRKPVSVAIPASEAFTDARYLASASSNHHLARYDSGLVERFAGVVARYGWYRTALFETVLRLADHRQSEIDARGGTDV
jgi:CRISPR-associated endonuclease/helicase Cas3